ncbi:hypothetical protein [Sorangium sp. So ce1099]|uniref:hypothetical protein n=1 Tax=Sorangium sp. So ce1099 TaxID=3133331 RepID=UPI003F612B5A
MKSTQHKEWKNEHRSAVTSPAEDTSVAFALDAQPATENAVATPSPAAAASDDDRGPPSGLIDLTALRASDESAQPRVLDLLPVFPFGEPPASVRAPVSASAPATPSHDGPRRAWHARSTAALLAAAAAVVAVTAGLAATRAADPGPPATAGLAAAARDAEARLPRIAAPAAEPAERAQSASQVERTIASVAGDEPDSAVAARRTPEGRARVTGTAAPQNGKSGPAAPDAADRRAPADPCRGDLMCAMRRAAGG